VIVLTLVSYFLPHHGPGFDSAPSENEYQEHIQEVKAAGEWDWRPHHLHVSNVMKIWEPKPPGTLWAIPGLLRDSFFPLALVYCRICNGGSINQGSVVRICQYLFPVGGVSVSSVSLVFLMLKLNFMRHGICYPLGSQELQYFLT